MGEPGGGGWQLAEGHGENVAGRRCPRHPELPYAGWMDRGRNKLGAGRIAALVAVCLFAGVVLNVAVAWGLVWLGQFVRLGPTPDAVSVTSAPVDAIALPDGLPHPDKFFKNELPGETYWQMLWDEPGPDGKAVWPSTRTTVAHLTRSGWPMRSLQHVQMFDLRNPGRIITVISPRSFAGWRSGIDLGLTRFGLFPVWPGFVVNSLLFAASIALVGWTLVTLRAALRMQRGQCTWCKYDRRGLAAGAPCPECGGLPAVAVAHPPGTGGPPGAR